MNSFSGNFMYNLKYFLTLITTLNVSISDFFLIYYILFSFCIINFFQIKFCKKLYNEVKIEIILLPKLTYLIPGIYRIHMYILGIFILIILKIKYKKNIKEVFFFFFDILWNFISECCSCINWVNILSVQSRTFHWYN